MDDIDAYDAALIARHPGAEFGGLGV